MDRYQFDDLISEYIENNLGFSKRKEFEAFMDSNPEARLKVEAVRSNIIKMRGMPQVKTSPAFMANLQSRIRQSDTVIAASAAKAHRTIFRLTPMYAGLLTLFVVGFVFTAVQFLSVGVNSGSGPAAGVPMASQNEQPGKAPTVQPGQHNDLLVDQSQDSLDNQNKPLKKDVDLNNKVQFVRSPQ